MPKMPLQVAAVASLALAACATPRAATSQPTEIQESKPMHGARYTYPDPPVVTSGELVSEGDPAISAKMNYKPVEWPLRFEKHSFGPRCYDTLEQLQVWRGQAYEVIGVLWPRLPQGLERQLRRGSQLSVCRQGDLAFQGWKCAQGRD